MKSRELVEACVISLEKKEMVQLSSIFTGFTKSRNGRKSSDDVGRDAAAALAKEAKKNEMMLTSSGSVAANNFTCVFSKGGNKGTNQDRFIVWEDFGCQDDMILCGVFDGHGPWGHLVSKRVQKLMPPTLLHNWQKRISSTMDCNGIPIDAIDIWKQTYIQTCSSIDQQLERYAHSYYSGTTALTLIRQGDLLVVANVGDSRAVVATRDDDAGGLVPLQLTVDLKPNLPRESERIMQSRGRVLSCDDEPGVYRVWGAAEGPGLAISRAFGDYYIKDFGLISEPELTYRNITCRDEFVILATDGIWDVLSNQEAVEIVSAAAEREEAAKRLVESAIRAWKRKRRGIAMDDISAICLFFHRIPPFQQEHKLTSTTI